MTDSKIIHARIPLDPEVQKKIEEAMARLKNEEAERRRKMREAGVLSRGKLS